MPPRGRKRKIPKSSDPEGEEKVRQLDELLKTFRQHCDEYEDYLNAQCEAICAKITKSYMDKLQSIPEHMRKMTISQIVELQKKENVPRSNTPKEEKTYRSAFERKKDETGKKRTLKKEKKRSLSASASNRPLAPNRGRDPTATFSRISRTMSESSLRTPIGRVARLPSMVVTPKFNPKLPMTQMARNPKADEILMSLSGSPIRNIANAVSLTLGQGKVITFNDEVEVEKEIKQMDEPLKETLRNVKDKLDKILNA